MTNRTRGLGPVIIHAVVDDDTGGRRGVTAADYDDKLEAFEFFLDEAHEVFQWRLAGSAVGQVADQDKFDCMASLYLTAFRDVRSRFSAASCPERADLTVS